jgi:hypothetical protein
MRDLRDELRRILAPYAYVCVSNALMEELMQFLAPELEKARRYDAADILIQQFKNSACTDRHVIGLVNSFVGIIEAMAGDVKNS